MIFPNTARPRRLFACFLAVALALGASKTLASENLIDNPGFESGMDNWGIFVPQESENKGCEFLISRTGAHTGSACAEMKSTDNARFSIGPKALKGDPLRPGDRCRLSFWIRADKGLSLKSSPGFVVRIFLLDDKGQNLNSNQAVFVGANGNTTVQSPQGGMDLSMLAIEIPTQWTKVEAVFTVPNESNAVRLGPPGFFAQYTVGSLFLDDVVMEKVDNAVPAATVAPKKH